MLRWGIIGTGKITYRFLEGLSHSKDSVLTAIAGRTEENLNKLADHYPNTQRYLDYEQLIHDPKVDAIYIALPHGIHYQWILKALKQKKAVLCEKPAVLTVEQMREVKRVAHEEQVLFMEAMKPRFTPAYQEVKEMVARGAIGTIQHVSTVLCAKLPQSYATYHYDEGQGGCLLDMGIYNASFIEDFIKGDLKVTSVDYETQAYPIEVFVEATLSNGGVSATLRTAFDRDEPKEAILYGTKGKIVISNFHRPDYFEIHTQVGVIERQSDLEYNDFYGEIKHFERCKNEEKIESEIMSHDDSIRAISIIEAIKETIKL